MKKETIYITTVILSLIVSSCHKQVKNVAEKSDASVGQYDEMADSVIEAERENTGIYILSDKDIYFKADTVLPNNPVINDMMDVANGYAILRAVYCDAELWIRLGGVVNEEIAQIKTDVIRDQEIRKATEKYVKTVLNILPNNPDLWEDQDSVAYDKVMKVYGKFARKLSTRYALEQYGKITEQDVERYMDIEQFIPDYEKVYKMRMERTEANKRFLSQKAEQATSFDVKCLYTVEYAHQVRYDEQKTAISKLEELMKAGKFSRYLHEVWRTWLVMVQMQRSPSRDGVILNLEYNQMRYRCLNTILKQIVRNPKDIKAINDFCFLATYDNIIRYGVFPYGNSANYEKMMLFPEFYEN